jgi:hypothetical protein
VTVTSEVVRLINEWNRNANGSVYRNELRAKLRWDRSGEKELGDLIEEHFKTQFQTNRRADERQLRIDYKKMRSLIEDKDGKVSQIVEPILASGWDFNDIRQEGKGRFDREPDRNEDFLRDMAVDDPYIDEMSDSQIGLLSALFKAWRYWHRRQSEGG